MTKHWLKELWRITGVVVVALVLGAITGRGGLFLFLGLLVYLTWHAWQLQRLLRHLVYRKPREPAFGDDVWGEIYYQFLRRKERARKRERKLKAVIKRYRESSAAMPDAALVLSPDNTIEWMNAAAASLLGLQRSDTGYRIDNLVRHPDFIRFLQAGDYDESLELASPVDDERMMEIHIVPYGDEQRLLVARDITRLHQLEVMRRDFIANVSHELSTPLTVISGYLEALGDRPREAEQLEQAVRQMRQQAERMTSLVADLLQLSRLETGATPGAEARVDIPAMLRELMADAAMLSGEHEFALEVDENLTLRGVADHLYSAFTNLLRNAVQYTPAGGHIRVRWRPCGRGGACFEVQDDGIGIPASLVPRLTERFFRVDAGRSRALGGTGLGLSIVKHVLRSHQGHLEVESTPGRGSTFRCVFPPDRVIVRGGDRHALK